MVTKAVRKSRKKAAAAPVIVEEQKEKGMVIPDVVPPIQGDIVSEEKLIPISEPIVQPDPTPVTQSRIIPVQTSQPIKSRVHPVIARTQMLIEAMRRRRAQINDTSVRVTATAPPIIASQISQASKQISKPSQRQVEPPKAPVRVAQQGGLGKLGSLLGRGIKSVGSKIGSFLVPKTKKNQASLFEKTKDSITNGIKMAGKAIVDTGTDYANQAINKGIGCINDSIAGLGRQVHKRELPGVDAYAKAMSNIGRLDTTMNRDNGGNISIPSGSSIGEGYKTGMRNATQDFLGVDNTDDVVMANSNPSNCNLLRLAADRVNAMNTNNSHMEALEYDAHQMDMQETPGEFVGPDVQQYQPQPLMLTDEDVDREIVDRKRNNKRVIVEDDAQMENDDFTVQLITKPIGNLNGQQLLQELNQIDLEVGTRQLLVQKEKQIEDNPFIVALDLKRDQVALQQNVTDNRAFVSQLSAANQEMAHFPEKQLAAQIAVMGDSAFARAELGQEQANLFASNRDMPMMSTAREKMKKLSQIYRGDAYQLAFTSTFESVPETKGKRATRATAPIQEDIVNTVDKTYSEIEPSSFHKILNSMRKQPNEVKLTADSRFFDIGHGLGMCTYQTAFEVGCVAHGIEYFQNKVDASQQLGKEYERIHGKEKLFENVQLRQGDVTQMEKIEDKGIPYSHIYSYNLTWGPDLMVPLTASLNNTNYKLLAWTKSPAETKKYGLNADHVDTVQATNVGEEKHTFYVYRNRNLIPDKEQILNTVQSTQGVDENFMPPQLREATKPILPEVQIGSVPVTPAQASGEYDEEAKEFSKYTNNVFASISKALMQAKQTIANQKIKTKLSQQQFLQSMADIVVGKPVTEDTIEKVSGIILQQPEFFKYQNIYEFNNPIKAGQKIEDYAQKMVFGYMKSVLMNSEKFGMLINSPELQNAKIILGKRIRGDMDPGYTVNVDEFIQTKAFKPVIENIPIESVPNIKQVLNVLDVREIIPPVQPSVAPPPPPPPLFQPEIQFTPPPQQSLPPPDIVVPMDTQQVGYKPVIAKKKIIIPTPLVEKVANVLEESKEPKDAQAAKNKSKQEAISKKEDKKALVNVIKTSSLIPKSKVEALLSLMKYKILPEAMQTSEQEYTKIHSNREALQQSNDYKTADSLEMTQQLLDILDSRQRLRQMNTSLEDYLKQHDSEYYLKDVITGYGIEGLDRLKVEGKQYAVGQNNVKKLKPENLFGPQIRELDTHLSELFKYTLPETIDAKSIKQIESLIKGAGAKIDPNDIADNEVASGDENNSELDEEEKVAFWEEAQYETKEEKAAA